MSRLITASLHSQINWYKICPQSWRGRAFTALVKSLGREYGEITGPGKRGIDFENEVYRVSRIKKTGGSKKFQKILNSVEGGVFQKKAKKFIVIDKVEYCLYTKLDVWFPTKIIDIKTTGKWDHNSSDKYLGSFQHQLYCYVTGIQDFEYLIAVFDGDEGMK